jgi:hypothetical protein
MMSTYSYSERPMVVDGKGHQMKSLSYSATPVVLLLETLSSMKNPPTVYKAKDSFTVITGSIEDLKIAVRIIKDANSKLAYQTEEKALTITVFDPRL